MTKQKTYEIPVTQESSEVSIPVTRGIGAIALSDEKQARIEAFERGDKHQDHGTRGTERFKELDEGFEGSKQRTSLADELELEDIDNETEADDFRQWERQMTGRLAYSTQSGDTQKKPTKKEKGQPDSVDADLELLGKTRREVESMTPDERSAFKQWLIDRTK